MKNNEKTTHSILSLVPRWIVVCAVFLMTSLGTSAAITIDGSFSDWSSADALGTDTSGDVSGGDIVDWTAMWAHSESGNLYLSYETAGTIEFATNAWRYGVYIDTDDSASSGYRGSAGNFLVGAEYYVEGSTLFVYTGDGTSWSWSSVTSCTSSATSNRLEMAIPESAMSLSGRYTANLMFYGGNSGTTDYANNDKSGMEISVGETPLATGGGLWRLLGTDATGDVSSGDLVDWTAMWAHSEDGVFSLSYETVGAIDFVSNAWRYAVYIDTDDDASTGFCGTDGDLLIGAEYLIEGSSIVPYTGTRTNWSWGTATAVSNVVSDNRVEMSLPESYFGLGSDYAINVMLWGNNPTTIDYCRDNKSGFKYYSIATAANAKSLETTEISWSPSSDENTAGYKVYRQQHRFDETPAITIDGSFADWNGVLGSDSAPYQPEDPTFIDTVWMTHDASNLYLRVRTATDFSTARSGLYVYIDADANHDTGTTNNWYFGLRIGADYRLRIAPDDQAGAKCYLDPYDSAYLPWSRTTGHDAAWTLSSSEFPSAQYALSSEDYGGATMSNNSFEVCMPLSSLGYTNGTDLVGMDLYFNYDGQDFFPTFGYAPGAPLWYEYGYHAVTPTTITNLNFTDTNVVGGTTNDYAIAAVSSNGTQEVLGTETLYTPSAHPLAFNVYMENSNSLSMAWQWPNDPWVTDVCVVRSTEHYPVNETDGTVVYEGTGTSYLDTGLTTATTYYYSAFGKDQDGDYSRRYWDSSDRSIPTIARGPIATLPVGGDFLTYFGFWDKERVDIAKKYDVVVLHPGGATPVITPAQVAEIQRGVDGLPDTPDDVKVVAYISVGEDPGIPTPGQLLNAPRSAASLPLALRTTNGPCHYNWETGEIEYENKGFPNFYVDEYDFSFNRMSGQGDEYPDQNQEWGSLYINLGDPTWQMFEKQATAANDGFIGLDAIINDLGADGFFLDTVGVSTPWSYFDTMFGDYYWVRDGALDYMARLCAWYPDAIILPNRPMHFCFDEFAGKRFDDFRAFTSAIFWESYSADVNYWWRGRNGELFEQEVQNAQDNSDERGFTTMGLDYYTVAIESLDGGYHQLGPWDVTISNLVARAEAADVVEQISPSRSLAELSDDVYMLHHPEDYQGAPDLFPAVIFATPTNTDQATLEIRICNQGPATSTGFRVRTLQNNDYLADEVISGGLDNWEIYTFYRTITLTNIGNNIHVEVDTDGVVAEFNEDNNHRDTLVDELLDPPHPGHVFEQELPPDVEVIKIETDPAIPMVGSNFTFRLSYTNNGPGVAGSSFMYMSIGTATSSMQIANFEAPYILPGECKVLDYDYQVDERQPYYIGTVADGGRELNEVNYGSETNGEREANNSLTLPFTVINSHAPVVDWDDVTNVLGPLHDGLGDGVPGLPSSDINNCWVGETTDDLVFRIEMGSNVNFSAMDHLIFLDTDNSASTGYLTSDMGADYLISEGNISEFNINSNQTDWAWDPLHPNLFGQLVVESNQCFLDITAPKSSLGLPTPCTPVKAYYYVSDGNTNTLSDDSYPAYGSSVQWPPVSGLLTIDGRFDDWDAEDAVELLATDGTNDGFNAQSGESEEFDSFADLQQAWSVSGTNYLFVRLDMLGNVNTFLADYIIYLDTDRDTSTGYGMSWGTQGSDYRVWDGQVQQYTNSEWSSVGAAPMMIGVLDNTQMEMAIPKSLIGWDGTDSLDVFIVTTDVNGAGWEDDSNDYCPELGQGGMSYPPVLLSDLVVSSVDFSGMANPFDPTAPFGGPYVDDTTTEVHVTVQNLGVGASEACQIKLWIDTVAQDLQTVPALAVSNWTVVDFSWTPTVEKLLYVGAQVDINNDVIELNDQNNSGGANVTVKGSINDTNTEVSISSMDGLFYDWARDESPIIFLGPDALLDGTAGSDSGDILDIYATDTPDTLFLAWELDGAFSSAFNYTIYMDTDLDPTTGYSASIGSLGADFMCVCTTGGGGTLWLHNGANQGWGWTQLVDNVHFSPGILQPYLAELALSRTTLGLTGTNQMISLRVDIDDNNVGTVNDVYPEDKLGGVVYPFSQATDHAVWVDGELDDWSLMPALATDGTNDGYDAYGNSTNTLESFADLRDLSVAYDEDRLYFLLDVRDMSPTGGVDMTDGDYAVYLDTDNTNSTGYTFNDVVGADYRVFDGFLEEHFGSTSNWEWNHVAVAPTRVQNDSTSRNQCEISVELSDVGLTNGSAISIFCMATDLNDSGWQDDIVDPMPDYGDGDINYSLSLPDLNITVTAPVTNEYRMTVENIGESASTNSTQLRADTLEIIGCIMQNVLTYYTIGPLDPGETVTWDLENPNGYGVDLDVDWESLILESRKDNNSFHISATIEWPGGIPGP